MSATAIVTVVTRNYIHYAHALAISVKRNCPDTPMLVVLADEPPDSFVPPKEWDHWVLGRDLGIPNWRRYAFQYTPFELSCALKSHAVEYAWKLGFDRVIFSDGDTQVYSPMTELREWLDESCIALTPHARWSKLSPGDNYEHLFLTAGLFNAGFFAVRRSAESERFLEWWKARVHKHCISDVPGGYCDDQKWLNLVPGMFSGVQIVKHCGYNVGHWMLSYQPEVKTVGGRVHIAGDPLSVFHFSCFRPELPDLITHHPGCTVADFPALAPLCRDYAALLKECNGPRYDTWGCAFATLSDGTKVEPLWREIIRQEHGRFANVDDPFDVVRNPEIAARLSALAPNFINSRKVWRLQYGVVGQQPKRGKLKAFGKRVEGLMRKVRDRGRSMYARLRLSRQAEPASEQVSPRRRAA